MSQIELRVESLFTREPAIERCFRLGLVNRRALARLLVQRGEVTREQFEAVVTALRRHPVVAAEPTSPDLFREVRVGLKDKIVIWDLDKDPALLRRLERVVAGIDYARGETLKLVVGTTSVKVFLDRAKEREVRPQLDPLRIRRRTEGISEFSLTFPKEATATPGVLSTLTRELSLHRVVVTELLTNSPELLIYLDDDQVTTAYETLRALRGGASPPGRRGTPSAGAR